MQAALFNTPRTGVNVLAASDAVGMGLNLNIRFVSRKITNILWCNKKQYKCYGHAILTIADHCI